MLLLDKNDNEIKFKIKRKIILEKFKCEYSTLDGKLTKSYQYLKIRSSTILR